MDTVNRKLTNTVLYLLKGCGSRPGITQLLKMIYYADYWHYREHLSSITGVEYVALERGPVLDNYKARFEEMTRAGAIKRLEIAVEGRSEKKVEFVAEIEPDESVFKDSERTVLDTVITKCGPLTGSALSHRTHKEGPWIFAWNPKEPGKKIPYTTFRWLDNLPTEGEVEIAKRSLKESGGLSRLLAV